jgi:hypothetical protein
MLYIALFREEAPVLCGGLDVADALRNLRTHGVEARPTRLVEVADAIVCAELTSEILDLDGTKHIALPLDVLEPLEGFAAFLEEVTDDASMVMRMKKEGDDNGDEDGSEEEDGT